MGYHALITLDFTGVTKDCIENFHRILAEEKWVKVRNQSSSWKVSFQQGVSRTGAIRTLEKDLLKAKLSSTINRVDYAIQMDTEDLLISNLQS